MYWIAAVPHVTAQAFNESLVAAAGVCRAVLVAVRAHDIHRFVLLYFCFYVAPANEQLEILCLD